MLFLFCLAAVATNKLYTAAFFVTPDKLRSIRTNKERDEYAQVLVYLERIYPLDSFKTFCRLFDSNNILKIFALLEFCEQQKDTVMQINSMLSGFREHLQHQTQIQDLSSHCIEDTKTSMSKEKVDHIINEILKAYLFMVNYCIKMYPPVQNPADSVKERIRKTLEAHVKNMQVGSAILIQIPIAEKVFSKEEEYDSFRKCKTIEEVEKKVQSYEMTRTKNMSQEVVQNESPNNKYAIILKGIDQPLSLPPSAPSVFQEAIDRSIQEDKPVCLDYKGVAPNGESIDVPIIKSRAFGSMNKRTSPKTTSSSYGSF